MRARLSLAWSRRSRPPATSLAEWFAVAIGAILLARFAYLNGGLVWGSDMLNYLDVGLRRVGDPFIANRYTHVYALRAATILAGSSLAGMRLFSGSVAGLSMLLIYISARRLTRQSNAANGLIAVLISLTLPLLMRLVLAPLVDTTLMVLVLATVALYVRAIQDSQSRRWVVIALGVVFVLASRTKEVGWVLLILLPGLGFGAEGEFEWPELLRSLRRFIIGLAIGILVTIAANAVFIGSPFFGYRLADIRELIRLWSAIVGTETEPAPSISQLILGESWPLAMLFAIAGIWFGRALHKAIRLVWLLPLLMLAFLLVATTRDAWTIVPRGFLAGFAVMSVLASRAFQVRLPITRPSIRQTLIAAGVIAGLLVLGEITRDELPFAAFFKAALAPSLLALVLAITILTQNRERAGWAIFALLLGFAGYSARLNLPATVADLEALGWRSRFALPQSLEGHIDLSAPFDAYVSWQSLEGLRGVANPEELAGIFNVALDAKTTSEDYRIGVVDEQLIRAMENAEHQYVVVSSSEWDWLRTAPQDRPEWRTRYEAFAEPGGRYILLSLKEVSNSG
jgi:hypothetical protein